MQTKYDKTANSIPQGGNVVDLNEFRRRLALAQRDSLARQPEPEAWSEEEPAFRPVVLAASREERRRMKRTRRAWLLDACASLAVVLMTLAFVLRILLW